MQISESDVVSKDISNRCFRPQ